MFFTAFTATKRLLDDLDDKLLAQNNIVVHPMIKTVTHACVAGSVAGLSFEMVSHPIHMVTRGVDSHSHRGHGLGHGHGHGHAHENSRLPVRTVLQRLYQTPLSHLYKGFWTHAKHMLPGSTAAFVVYEVSFQLLKSALMEEGEGEG